MIPHDTQDALGQDLVRAACQNKAHDVYAIEGMHLNDLRALALRLEQREPMHPFERLKWGAVLRSLIESATLTLEV